jgi:hypothetical protein
MLFNLQCSGYVALSWRRGGLNKGDYDISMWFFKAFHFTFSSLEWVVSLIVHDVILSRYLHGSLIGQQGHLCDSLIVCAFQVP